ncbi:MAG: GSCFA domain-containing protein [Bacteroidales bacterium]|nr:GSCFA domain-containing protein [Bacteroidales bacterium]MDD4684633.1 GSCFA domain-containing protein [Bacteroidales bacterium]
MIFRTEISPKKTLQPIQHSDSISLIGSCFTQSIGNKLRENGFTTDINPFGIIYNPITISECMESISTKKFLKDEDLIFGGDFFKAYSHHGDFKSQTKEGLLEIINTRIEESNRFTRDSKYLILTLGSAWVYVHNETNRVMGNCHKMNANLFTKKLLSISEIVESMTNSINLFFSNNKNKDSKIIITISPIRHWKDGYRENQISKSILHLATEEICNKNSRVEYFPSYEILMDDLRDYRFYADDMLHPNNLVVEYIWEKFQNTYFNPKTIKLAKRFEDLQRMKKHRVLNPDTDNHKAFLKKIEALEEELRVEKNK